MKNLIVHMWDELTGRAALERELHRFRSAITRVQVGEGARPEDLLLYLLLVQPRDEHGNITLHASTEALMRKSLSVAEMDRDQRVRLAAVASGLRETADVLMDKKLPISAGRVRSAAHAFLDYLGKVQ